MYLNDEEKGKILAFRELKSGSIWFNQKRRNIFIVQPLICGSRSMNGSVFLLENPIFICILYKKGQQIFFHHIFSCLSCIKNIYIIIRQSLFGNLSHIW